MSSNKNTLSRKSIKRKISTNSISSGKTVTNDNNEQKDENNIETEDDNDETDINFDEDELIKRLDTLMVRKIKILIKKSRRLPKVMCKYGKTFEDLQKVICEGFKLFV